MTEKLTSECRPDYEKEYYRLIDEIKQLETANYRLREIILGMCDTFFRERENNG